MVYYHVLQYLIKIGTPYWLCCHLHFPQPTDDGSPHLSSFLVHEPRSPQWAAGVGVLGSGLIHCVRVYLPTTPSKSIVAFQSRKQLYNPKCPSVCLSVWKQNPQTALNQSFHLITTFTTISQSSVSHPTFNYHLHLSIERLLRLFGLFFLLFANIV